MARMMQRAFSLGRIAGKRLRSDQPVGVRVDADATELPLDTRVPNVFDLVVCTPRQLRCNLGPPVAYIDHNPHLS